MATSNLHADKSDNLSPSAPPLPKQIRFVNTQGQPANKRRRINAACRTCHRRKTRCLGERPTCSTCAKSGHKCQGYPEEGKAPDFKGDLSDEDAEEGGKADVKVVKKAKGAIATRAAASTTTPTTTAAKSSRSSTAASAASRSSQKPAVAKPAPVPSATVASDANAKPDRPTTTHRANVSVNTVLSHTPDPDSPTMRRNPQANSHRVPYFRYFGPTAIVPGFKQMVVSVKDRRRSTNGSHSISSPLSQPSGILGSAVADSDVIVEDAPVYDPNDPAPVHALILNLTKLFFVHLGCNYPFLKQSKFLNLVKDKRAEPILVDAVCALAARFSDSPILTGGNDKMPRTERGHVFAQRAKQATVDTFPCPTVAAVQACLLMAYEGFGANQDSALWMYLGLAIRMAVDLGLQKRIGILYQGENDPWNVQRRATESASPELTMAQPDTPSHEEQRELEQERIDTFWAVFFLDRVISSGTGRPVTLRDEDFELAFPKLKLHPDVRWPSPFPTLIEIVHLYGRVSDVLNNIHDASDLTQDKWQKLMAMESRLTKVYKGWDARLQFNVGNFKAYLGIGQGTTFILLHFWFHALFIILHQPTLLTPFGELRSELQLLRDSRELSMSSAKTICDILSFADLIDPKSFIGNPFTSQPMYIAACAFLMESSATASQAPSPVRESSPPEPAQAPPSGKTQRQHSRDNGKKSRHSLLASAANQNYQRCYQSLENLHTYWGGVKYILTALDQKAKGIWDCETYTTEEFESTKPKQGGFEVGQLPFEDPSSPSRTGPPIGWALAGTANSPNSSLTLMYQNTHPHSGALEDGRSGAMYPPAIPQSTTSAVRSSPRNHPSSMRQSNLHTLLEAAHTTAYIGPNQPSSSFEYGASPSVADVAARQAYYQDAATHTSHNHGSSGSSSNNVYWGGASGNMDAITFNSQDIDIGALGLQQPDLMGGWLDYIPGDVLGLFDNQDMEHGPAP
ncbi:putative pathway-specific nitrogen regulator [Emericellopsis atlantica]|uniref:Pathway-specific nitrogen regulator n=1 Tax=Emericellopsis atlantica TaxID=2614577 RepID=A0A9P7ZQE1_9HYPO|nr:putative pathway-specific nitrogen regulator [Emericellopsis atlantica]KAG9256181.1 putative pathway-specific nitrogen regulator [Emericellopsis atlantica]